MKIECFLKRPGGTHVDLGTAVYHFAPDKSDRHVCTIEDETHVQMLLNIPEAYGEYQKDVPYSQPKPFDSDDGNDAIVVAPEDMSNKDLIDWAKDHGFNPKSKTSIELYGRDKYAVELDRRMSPVNMIRQIVIAEVAAMETERD